MHILYPSKRDLRRTLRDTGTGSQDFVIVITGALGHTEVRSLKDDLEEFVRVLRNGGLMFVQGCPEYLPELGVFLDRQLNFKYWIAIESSQLADRRLPSVHGAVLLFCKGNHRFNIKRTRFAHQNCSFCSRSLRDWGGKSHLMHPEGYVISDVWTHLPPDDNYSRLSPPALHTIMRMLDFGDDAKGIVGPREGIQPRAEPPLGSELAARRRKFDHSSVTNELSSDLVNVVHRGDAIETLKRYPGNSIDLAFADPPYNLNKAYGVYPIYRAPC